MSAPPSTRSVPRWRLHQLGALTLFGLGLGALGLAVARGEAQVAWVIIVPVVYGGSLLLLLGAFAWIAGFAWLALGSGWATDAEPSGNVPEGGSARWEPRGLVLIGPFPILFGSWGPGARWVYRVAFVVGVALVVLAVAVVLGVVG